MKRLFLCISFYALLPAQIPEFNHAILFFDPKKDENIQSGKITIMVDLIHAVQKAVAPVLMSPSLWDLIMLRRERFKELAFGSASEKYLKDLKSKFYSKFLLKPGYSVEQAIIEAYKQYGSWFNDIHAIMAQHPASWEHVVRKKYPEGMLIPEALKNTEFKEELAVDLKCFAMSFVENDWIIKQLLNAAGQPIFYLFIPKSYSIFMEQRLGFYQKFLGQPSVSVKDESAFGKLLVQDILLGLKISQLSEFKNPLQSRSVGAHYDIQTNDLSKVFVTRSDIFSGIFGKQERFEALLFPWLIAMQGHGSRGKGGVIAGMKEETFFNLLQFFNQYVNTNLLFYDTCFSGGVDVGLLRNFQPGKPDAAVYEDLNYILITGAISDVPTISTFSYIDMPPYKANYAIRTEAIQGIPRLKNVVTQDFRKFFEWVQAFFMRRYSPNEVKKYGGQISKSTLLSKAIQFIHPFGVAPGKDIIGNIPQIRFPHTHWLQVSDMENKVFVLSQTKIISRLAEKSNQALPIKNQLVLLVYAPVIPILLSISGTMPTIISMVPGDASHYFKEIDAGTLPFSAFIKSLYFLGEQAFQKAFLIDSLKINFDNNDPVFQGLNGQQILEQVKVIYNGKNIFEDTKEPMHVIYFAVKHKGEIQHYATRWLPTLEATRIALLPWFRLDLHLPVAQKTVRRLNQYTPAPMEEGLRKVAGAFEQSVATKKILQELQTMSEAERARKKVRSSPEMRRLIEYAEHALNMTTPEMPKPASDKSEYSYQEMLKKFVNQLQKLHEAFKAKG